MGFLTCLPLAANVNECASMLKTVNLRGVGLSQNEIY